MTINKQVRQQGFTLIEVLISLVILSVMAGGLLSLQYILSQNQILILNTYKSQDEVNATINAFIKEVRSAKTSDNGSYPLESLADSQIVFYSDIDFDGTTERVRYFLTGTQLAKGVIKPVGYPATYPQVNESIKTVVSEVRNLSAPVFYYYNSAWPTDATNNPLVLANRLSDTRTIKIHLRVNKKVNDADNDFVLESQAQVRMLKDNL